MSFFDHVPILTAHANPANPAHDRGTESNNSAYDLPTPLNTNTPTVTAHQINLDQTQPLPLLPPLPVSEPVQLPVETKPESEQAQLVKKDISDDTLILTNTIYDQNIERHPLLLQNLLTASTFTQIKPHYFIIQKEIQV